jgi:hypothetical protein
MRQLFQCQAQDVQRGLRAVLQVWEEKAVVLRDVAGRASAEGRTELAETFIREADLLHVRIERLREQLRASELPKRLIGRRMTHGSPSSRTVNCPLCRRELRSAGKPTAGAIGHGFSAPELLAEQSTLASRLLRGVVGSLESTIALSADLARRRRRTARRRSSAASSASSTTGRGPSRSSARSLLDDPDELDAYRI